MLKRDYMVNTIDAMIRAAFKFIFKVEFRGEKSNQILDNKAEETYKTLIALIDAGKMNEAENQLFEDLDEEDLEGLKVALMFYTYVNSLSDTILDRADYGRTEVKEGLKDVLIMFGYRGVTELFMDLEEEE